MSDLEKSIGYQSSPKLLLPFAQKSSHVVINARIVPTKNNCITKRLQAVETQDEARQKGSATYFDQVFASHYVTYNEIRYLLKLSDEGAEPG